MKTPVIIALVVLLFSFQGCQKEAINLSENNFTDTISTNDTNTNDTSCYLTKNIIVIVIDGARYSETWGDTSHQNIPRLAEQLAGSGIINTEFYNNGPTYTMAGHTSITTGFYQEINNAGNEFPKYASFFQYWNAKHNSCNELSWIITSKDKLEVLDNCLDGEFKYRYQTSTNCGINGLASGYRHDSITVEVVLDVLQEHSPNLVLVNFREPDYSAHSGSWDNYLNGIKSSDEFAYQIWNYIEQDSSYKGKTSLFITNDHGRHLDSISNGFISHGDNCMGCRHILLYAFGPDFKQGIIVNEQRDLVDITATIAELLSLNMKYGEGKVMEELFK